MKLSLCEFYLIYNHSGNYINHQFVKRIEINNYGKIEIDDKFITPKEHFDIYL